MHIQICILSVQFDTGIYRYAAAKATVELNFVPTVVNYITRMGFVFGLIGLLYWNIKTTKVSKTLKLKFIFKNSILNAIIKYKCLRLKKSIYTALDKLVMQIDEANFVKTVLKCTQVRKKTSKLS